MLNAYAGDQAMGQTMGQMRADGASIRQPTVLDEFGRWVTDVDRLRAMVAMSLEGARQKAHDAAAEIRQYTQMLHILEGTLKSCNEPMREESRATR